MFAFIEKRVREGIVVAHEQEMMEKRLPALSHWLHSQVTEEQFPAVKKEHLDMLLTVMAKGAEKEGIILKLANLYKGEGWEARESQSLKDHIGIHVIFVRELGFVRSILYSGAGEQRRYKLGVLFAKSLEEMRRESEVSKNLVAGNPRQAMLLFSEKNHSLTATREHPVGVITNEVYHLVGAPYVAVGHAPLHVWVYASSPR